MKRTPLNRKTPWRCQGKGPSRNKPLRRKGARAIRDEEHEERFRQTVKRRAGNRCERCGSFWGLQAHHRNRRRGKTPEERHDPAKGSCLCAFCHEKIHRHAVEDWQDWFD